MKISVKLCRRHVFLQVDRQSRCRGESQEKNSDDVKLTGHDNDGHCSSSCPVLLWADRQSRHSIGGRSREDLGLRALSVIGEKACWAGKHGNDGL